MKRAKRLTLQMNSKQSKTLSKFLSLILRHNPGKIGLSLDKNGWGDLSELIQNCKVSGKDISIEDIEYVVATNNKKRFEFDEDKRKIRACQGHSINIDLALDPTCPPDTLYHGTATETVEYIKYDGILKMGRDYVHLTSDYQTAVNTGNRHGKPKVLLIDAKKMHKHGMEFFLANNGVWLTEFVPEEYIIYYF